MMEERQAPEGPQPASSETPAIPSPSPPEPPPIPRLRRSKTERVIAGVCGGLGVYLGIDPVLVRLVFVALTLAGGAGLLIYIIAWIVIPEGEIEPAFGAGRAHEQDTGRIVVGVILVLVGAVFILHRIVPWFDVQITWPAIVILVGLFLLLRGVRR